MRMPNEALLSVMRSAYSCIHFGSCRDAEFAPERGLIPRGFVGATERLEDVEAIFVVAEPGHAYDGEKYTKGGSADLLAREAVAHTYQSFKTGKDQFHRNMRWVLNELWGGEFDDQLSKVWITEGRLCSIPDETGPFKDKLCAPTYLSRQIALMPHAAIVLFGGKARDRVIKLPQITGMTVIVASALAAPEGNKPRARASWCNAVDIIRQRREEQG